MAKELIDFDREFSRRFRGRGEAGDPEEFQRYFVQQGRFTAGVATRYAPSLLTAATRHQALATGFPVGMRLHSVPVLRLADAKPVQLGHVARADGRWRLYVFADADGARARELCAFLAGEVARHTPAGADPDAVIDVRAVFQQGHRELAVDTLPPVLVPRKGRFGLIDYEKAFCPDPKAGDAFEERGIDRAGCMVVARPDQYVSHVLPLDAHDELTAFFARILR